MATKTGAPDDAVQTNASDEAISQRIIEAVADAKGVDPLDLPPLYDSIDPDALDALFSHGASAISITDLRFEVEDCAVLVRGSGEIVVTHLADKLATSDDASQTAQNISRDPVEDRCGIGIGVPGRLDTYHA